MKFVVNCISVIQIRTSVKKFSVNIIQIKIRVESIQIHHRAGSEFLNRRMATEDWWIIDELFMSDSLHSIN